MIILHSFWLSLATYRVRIALNLKRVEFEERPHDLLQGRQHDPAFRGVNPAGAVPPNQVLTKLAWVAGRLVVSRKITDSPGAMLVMPFSATAAAGDCELSSTFQPLMSMAKVKLEQLSEHGALLDRYGASVRVLGQRELINPDVLKAVDKAVSMTAHNNKWVPSRLWSSHGNLTFAGLF